MRGKFFRKILLMVTTFCFCAAVCFTSKIEAKAAITADKQISCDLESEASSISGTYESRLFLTDNYATHYFSNLTTNYGVNVKGSCTYIALGMLLSFYDTYWDDGIIPENYDMITMLETNSINTSLESPGIYKDPNAVTYTNITTEDYYQGVEKYSSSHLHLKLIQMGKEQFGQYKFDNPASPCGLTYGELKELTEYYLYEYLGLGENSISFISNKDQNKTARDFTISMIEQGIPVILRAGSTSGSGGHAMIAYDYDATTGTIYGHLGWQLGNDMHNDMVLYKYDNFWDASTIIINSNHSCSNNFKYSNEYETLETHCVCDLSIHPTRYNITYDNLDFQGTTATFFVDDLYVANPPSSYAWVSGLDLSNITAWMSGSGPYSPQMVFIGWCSDAALTQPITNIPQYSVGDITLYAKWRYDYNAVTATRTYLMIADNQKFTHYDTATIGMNVEGLYENLTAIGIEYLAVRINISIQAPYSSQKRIYFYGDSTQSSYLGEIAFNYQGAGVYTTTAYLPIETIEDVGILYLRYGGSGGFATWGTDQIFLEIMYVAEQEDVAAAPFTWDYQNPFL